MPATRLNPRTGTARDRLLEAARTRFAERGFAATSTRALAGDAGVNVQLIAHYFGNKRGLLCAVVEEFASEADQLTQPLFDEPGSPRSRLTHLLRLGARLVLAEAPRARLLQRVLQEGEPELVARIIELTAPRVTVLRRLIEEAILVGELRADLDPALTAGSIWAMYQWYALMGPHSGELLGHADGSPDPDALAAHTLRLFFDGAAPDTRHND
jgi:AcrR family transcriptional regulator